MQFASFAPGCCAVRDRCVDIGDWPDTWRATRRSGVILRLPLTPPFGRLANRLLQAFAFARALAGSVLIMRLGLAAAIARTAVQGRSTAFRRRLPDPAHPVRPAARERNDERRQRHDHDRGDFPRLDGRSGSAAFVSINQTLFLLHMTFRRNAQPQGCQSRRHRRGTNFWISL
jgi:hypothetical protein